jgi:hypothetical protein
MASLREVHAAQEILKARDVAEWIKVRIPLEMQGLRNPRFQGLLQLLER